jgi:hypothetical protein
VDERGSESERKSDTLDGVSLEHLPWHVTIGDWLLQVRKHYRFEKGHNVTYWPVCCGRVRNHTQEWNKKGRTSALLSSLTITSHNKEDT